MEFSYELKIPKERVAVLIGVKGSIKRRIEKETKTQIDVDSKEGDVVVKGDDALGLYTAREIVRAIARGFNPEYALLLLKQDYSFEVFDVTEFAGRNKNVIARLKGRVIGKEGKSRRLVEELSETNLCVYGKTVGIIGEMSRVGIARKAIESLLSGSPHSNVYRWLEKQRREMKRQEFASGDVGF